MYLHKVENINFETWLEHVFYLPLKNQPEINIWHACWCEETACCNITVIRNNNADIVIWNQASWAILRTENVITGNSLKWMLIVSSSRCRNRYSSSDSFDMVERKTIRFSTEFYIFIWINEQNESEKIIMLCHIMIWKKKMSGHSIVLWWLRRFHPSSRSTSSIVREKVKCLFCLVTYRRPSCRIHGCPHRLFLWTIERLDDDDCPNQSQCLHLPSSLLFLPVYAAFKIKIKTKKNVRFTTICHTFYGFIYIRFLWQKHLLDETNLLLTSSGPESLSDDDSGAAFFFGILNQYSTKKTKNN